MEIVVPPGQLPPRPSSNEDYGMNDSPTIPEIVRIQNNDHHYSTQSAPDYNNRQAVTTSVSYGPNLEGTSPSRPTLGSKAYSMPGSSNEQPKQRLTTNEYPQKTPQLMELDIRFERPLSGSMPGETSRLPQLSPAMDRSSQKILQLAGLDSGVDRMLHDKQERLSPTSSKSSGSNYSQPGIDLQDSSLNSKPAPVSSSSRPPPKHNETTYDQSGMYSSSENSASHRTSGTAPPQRDSGDSQQQRNSKFLENVDTDDITALDARLFQEQNQPRYASGFESEVGSKYRPGSVEPTLVPKPLTLQPKNKQMKLQPIIVPQKRSLLANVRESFAWGVDELTSPKTRPRFNTHVLETFVTPKDPSLSTTNMPPPPLPPYSKRKRFGTGKHPLKSPYPLKSTTHNPSGTRLDSGAAEVKFSQRISGAMKHWSAGSSKGSPTETMIIPSKARKAEGPDTPLPPRSGGSGGFMNFSPVEAMYKGNEHIQDAVAKAKKKVSIKSSKEKRRESLKKKIVVVGITDQSPDGRVAEWL